MTGLAEKFVNNVRELSQSSANANALFNYLTKSYEPLLKCPVAHLDNALETLLPDQHASGMVAILSVKYQQLQIEIPTTRKYGAIDDGELTKLVTQTATFVEACNMEQVHLVTDFFTEMLHHCSEIMIERKEPSRAIQLMIRGIERLCGTESLLTPVHTDLCHLCLCAKNFQPALPFLDIDITDIQKTTFTHKIDSKPFLLYYYYGGMIYAAVKNFKRSAFFFEIAISTPASVVSAIMVESYKKYILVSLLAKRAEPAQPKYTAPVLGRYMKANALPYQDLASAYATSTQSTLQAMADKHKTTYERDNNYGLVKQCVRSLYKKNIQRLTKTFLTLPLSDVANRVHLTDSAEAERYLLEMIEDGEIHATINKRDGMVEFHDNPEKYNNPAMLSFLQKQENACMAINAKMSEFERIIAVTPDYVNKYAVYSGEDEGLASKAGSSGILPDKLY